MKTDLELTIERTFGKILYKFPFLSKNENTGNEGFIVYQKDKRFVVLVNDNVPYIADKKDIDLKLAELSEVSFSLTKAKTLLSFNEST